MLTIYGGTKKNCEHRGEGRAYRRCRCMIWVDGSVGGEKSGSLCKTGLAEGSGYCTGMEADGQRVEEVQPIM